MVPFKLCDKVNINLQMALALQLKNDSFDRRRQMQNFTKPASTLTALSIHCMYTDSELCAFFFQVEIFFPMTVEEIFKFVEKIKQVIVFLFLLLVLKNTKLTTNSTNAMCNISKIMLLVWDFVKA